MSYVLVGFLGVLLGGAVSAAMALLLLQRAVDRDLVERRLRALVAYREILGTPLSPEFGPKGTLEPLELDQIILNLEAAVREFRLTAWVFDEAQRAELARAFLVFEEEVRRSRRRGERPSPVKVIDSYRQLELALRHAAARSLREFRRWRFLPLGHAERSEEGGSAPPAGAFPEAGVPDRDVPAR